jgi:hypothetical protein
MTVDDAILELNMKAGTQFWPDAVEALLSISRKMLQTMAMANHNNHSG